MPSALTRALRRGDLDLGVSFDYPEIGDTFGDDLEVEHLLDDPFDVVVPRGHRLERKRTIRFAELGGENWLLGDFGADSPSFRMIDRRCRDAGFDPHVAYRINDCQMAQALVAAGEGIALLPRLMLRAAQPRRRDQATRRRPSQPPRVSDSPVDEIPDPRYRALPRAARRGQRRPRPRTCGRELSASHHLGLRRTHRPLSEGRLSMGWRRDEVWFDTDVLWFREQPRKPFVESRWRCRRLPPAGSNRLSRSRSRRGSRRHGSGGWRRRRREGAGSPRAPCRRSRSSSGRPRCCRSPRSGTAAAGRAPARCRRIRRA